MLIGITGTNGSGKGTVVEYLVMHKGFSHFSARMFIIEEVVKRGLKQNRRTMREVANEMRKEHSPSYLMERLYEMAKDEPKAVLESVRTIGEAEFLKAKGVYLFAVDADRTLRHERIVARGAEGDNLSYEEFCEQEDAEMASPDPWDMNVFGVMQISDARLMNNGTVEDLHHQVDEALAAVQKV
ncbi:MAG TPA: AAA family ATPase [Candidatus Paceibacterota bacterium]|nr:AAA family ATPase [Candidatus Paceibacterota bacterium]